VLPPNLWSTRYESYARPAEVAQVVRVFYARAQGDALSPYMLLGTEWEEEYQISGAKS
jgi:hypothetical protein